ncbi:thermonuclease family protein [Roseococcus sp. SYP-B2431]|uniref:thermonuclease family protein n=1 Tax=Roseococcus sp. SYP-B2431 TaxID=2496640 RepID=UPI00103E19CA|nr:thermonuclease family protein [Roseococcus sp. SYP-B2431]TCH99960.1 thermonuclease family protein [Roseococcus sp. SYP-B2431]
MRRRRLFQTARTPQRWGRAFALTASGVLGGVLVVLGLPTELMGSAPRNQEWSSPAAQIRIVDGDTLRLGDRTLRLYGVEAPERGQFCTNEQGALYDCGTAAAAELARLVGERGVECRVQGRDRFGRALGVCRAGGVELNTALVTSGWALADGGSLPALVPVEAAARSAQRGLWAGGFEPPAHWRRGY